MIVIYCVCKRRKDFDDSTESNTSSSPSSSEQRSNQHCSHRRYNSYYVDGYPSPPPPYVAHDHRKRLFATTSLPPSYSSYSIESETTHSNSSGIITINVDEPERLGNSSSHDITGTTVDHSLLSQHSSVQTYHF